MASINGELKVVDPWGRDHIPTLAPTLETLWLPPLPK